MRLVNAHRVPPALQEELLAGVGDLAGQTPVCVPPAKRASAPAATPPVSAPTVRAGGHVTKAKGGGGHAKKQKKAKKHGKGR